MGITRVLLKYLIRNTFINLTRKLYPIEFPQVRDLWSIMKRFGTNTYIESKRNVGNYLGR